MLDLALDEILGDIREDLAEFGVTFDEWFSERSLADSGAIDRALERLKASGHVYSKDGALWFKATDYGDEKDRVVERENGQRTYFASDIAYHLHKRERGFRAAHRRAGRGSSRLRDARASGPECDGRAG